KEILRVEREIVPIPRDLIELARWIAAYYCTPIGLTLSTMVPAAVKRATRIPAEMVVSAASGGSVDELSPRTKKTLEKLLAAIENVAKPEKELLEQLGVSRPTLRKLADKGFIKIERQLVNPDAAAPGSGGHALSPDQQAAFDALEPLLKNPKF